MTDQKPAPPPSVEPSLSGGGSATPIDKTAFIAALFESQGTALVKFLAARYADPETAREVAQEAWLRIYRMDQPERLQNAKAFLFQTAANLAVDRLRRLAVERRHQDSEAQRDDLNSGVDIEKLVADRESLERIQRALDELPPKCRQAFLLHRTVGRSYAEIADELSVSVSMVEKYIIRALKHFRNTLQ